MTTTRRARRLKRIGLSIIFVLGARAVAVGAPINTNDINVYNAFATGATVQNFENVSGMTPLDLSSYANALNSTTAVPAAAQLSLDIDGLLFHSGGGSFNDPTGAGKQGTPTALLSLSGGTAGDAHSATNVVGSLEINSENLDLDQFIEVVFINSLQSRVGFWLNPSLGNVLFTAFDSTGTQLEQQTGTAGNFVGFERASADIHFISVIGLNGTGFTVDDLTYAGATDTGTTDTGTTDTGTTDTGGATDTGATDTSNAVPEPASLSLLGLGAASLGARRWGQRKSS